MSEPLDPYRTPSAPPPPPGPPAVGARPGLPWDREKSGNAFIDTVKRLVTAPAVAFREALQKGDYVSPLIFGVVLATFGAVVGQLWNLLFGAAWVETLVPAMPPESREILEQAFAPSLAGVLFSLVLGPIFAVIGMFIWSGILHLFLLILGGTRDSVAGFEGTFRAVAYSEVSYLAAVIPVVGSFIQLPWLLVLEIIGLAKLHQTDTWRAVLAVLLPLILCCVCIGAVFGTAIMAAIGAANQ